VQGFQQYAFMFSMPLIIGLYLKNRFLAPFITFVAIASVFGLTRLCEEMEGELPGLLPSCWPPHTPQEVMPSGSLAMTADESGSTRVMSSCPRC